MINERCTEILLYIIREEKPIKINELSEEFNLSTRTIRYDIDKIDEFLMSNNQDLLCRDSKMGIHYKINKKRFENLKFEICKRGYNDYIFSTDERVNYILISLFESKKYVVIDKLAEKLKVSRSTVINDLKKVRKWLAEHNLFFEAIPSKGIRIEGKEKDYRSAVLYLLFESMNFNVSAKIIRNMEPEKNIYLNNEFENFFEDLDFNVIKDAVSSAEKQLNRYLSDESFSSLVLHIALAIKRIQVGKDIHMSHNELKSLKFLNEFSVASTIVKLLESEFNLTVPVDEIGYITLHLLSGNESNEGEIQNQKNWIQVQDLSRKIIENAKMKTEFDFTNEDILYEGLLKHLGPAIYRLKNDLPLYNPMLKEIKEQYQSLYNDIETAIKPLQMFVGKKIPDEEIGYITMHFGAACERTKRHAKNSYKVILVCGTGVGTSKLLESRIRNEFSNLIVVDTTSVRHIQNMNLDNIDFVLSTIEMDNLEKPVLTISPMLSLKEIEKINKFCKDQDPKNLADIRISSNLLDELLDVVERNCSIVDKMRLVEEISYCLEKAGFHNTREVEKPMLSELLTENMIKVNVEADNWEEAVRKSGEILVTNECVEAKFVDAMVETVKEMGAYIVIVPGIALPHARPENGVKKMGMSLVKLETPLNFGSKENDPVNVVISLAAIDNHSHLKALATLVNLFNDEERVEILKSAQTIEEILPLLKDLNGENGK